jgi:hypothetical protein
MKKNMQKTDLVQVNNYTYKAFLVVLAVSAFFLTHAYNGIRHDGILYMGQALIKLHPNLHLDPFFVFGSQNNYTIFSFIYAFFIKLLGLNLAAILLLIVGQFLFLASIFYLASKFVDFRFVVLGIICVAIFYPFYGGYGLISYAEAFLTARTYAEPFSIFAIALAVDKKWVISIIFIAIALLFHPLMALCALFFLWLKYSSDHHLAFGLPILGFALSVVLGLFGVKPFNHLFVFFDPYWWQLVKTHNPLCIVSMWKWRFWYILGYDVLIGICGYFYGSKKLKNLFGLVLVINAVSFLISFVGGDLLKNVLILGLQLWRAQWLLHLFSMLFLPYIVYAMWNKSITGKLLAVAIVSIVVNVFENGYTTFFEAGLLIIFLILSYMSNINLNEKFKELFKKQNLVWAGAILTLVACERFIWLYQISFYPIDFGLFGGYQFLRVAYFGISLVLFYLFAKNIKISKGLIVFLSILFVVILIFAFRGINFKSFEYFLSFDKNPYAINRGFVLFVIGIIYILYTIMPKIGIPLIIFALVASAVLWDQRTSFDKYIETHTTNNPFYSKITPKSQIYFNGQLKWVWILFNEPCFYSRQQCSGDLFNRKSAVLIEKRLKLIDSNKKDLLNVCLLDKNLGYIVSLSKINNTKPFLEWHLKLKDKTEKLYLYDCKIIRKQLL